MSMFYLKTILILILIATAFASFSRRRPKDFKSYRRTITVNAQGSVRNYTNPKHVFHDMPTKKDVYVYLKSLQRIIDFSAANKNEIDINLVFGLFHVNGKNNNNRATLVFKTAFELRIYNSHIIIER